MIIQILLTHTKPKERSLEAEKSTTRKLASPFCPKFEYAEGDLTLPLLMRSSGIFSKLFVRGYTIIRSMSPFCS